MDDFKKNLTMMSNDDLFELLDAVSEEVKRRNSLLGPSVSDIRNQPVERTVEGFLSALGEIGWRMGKPPPK